jgi:hypothetical protein
MLTAEKKVTTNMLASGNTIGCMAVEFMSSMVAKFG